VGDGVGPRGAARPPGGAAVRLRGLRKRFGETLAVDGVDLELRAGEIHALLGENGAGKTTLMCMLAGLYRPDGGELEVLGRATAGFASPRAAMAAGIGMVHQHFMLVPTLTVAENVLLGAERIPRWLRRGRLEREVQASADRLGLRVAAGRLAGELSVGEQQRVEILRVLARGARVMILDEPTAVLSPLEAEALFASLRKLAGEGTALVLISHKLEELRAVADRLTVMRRGRVVASFAEPRAAEASELASAMVGRAVSLELERGAACAPGRPLLSARGLSVRDRRGLEAVRGLELELRAGEVTGLCGVSGNGQRELFEALYGLAPIAGGELELAGERVTDAPVRRRLALGLRYIPEDRQRTGSAPSLSVLENLALRRYRLAPARSGPWLRLARLEGFCRERVAALQVAVSSLATRASLLSGGNLQKLIVARELDDAGQAPARVILALHPTRGLDAWATAEVRRLLLAARAGGAAILLCSEDFDEVLALADRVLVMARGELVYSADAASADRLAIARAMTGAEAAR
jgi:simple sugar transport system ATP-binding protein